jgi:DNA excision repair protein ERCC-3
VDVFYAGGSERGGSGVIVLPCGAGKTVTGMAIIAEVAASTPILTPSTVAVRQWIDELIDKTHVPRDSLGEYSGQMKQIRPITISTYQTMTYRPRKTASFPHLAIFSERDWGLIIYDEVHLLPAPVFRATAGIQAHRRLGLTATLVREDGRAGDVFSLIGPKKYDVPWKVLEAQGWIAAAECAEIRLPLTDERRLEYALAPERSKYGIAATNPRKLDVLGQLLEAHERDSVLIIGQYLDQLRAIADEYEIPLITGKTAVAQRLGRILRPRSNGTNATFYAIVSRDTVDQEYAAKRQMFLTERGYRYHIAYEDEVDDLARTRAAQAGRAVGEVS